uniref:Uncharacterized protein n=1 Tax=Pithovirus LCPAC406 TaxID=2506599 RepID=A0A481ZD41_9VIRU|nr:MAG: uncharacterized protein LCPAC406_01480 [Pithovirus LCPAC406]
MNRRRQITTRSRSFARVASRSVINPNKSAISFTNDEIKSVSFSDDSIVKLLTKISKSDRFSLENNILARKLLYEAMDYNHGPTKITSVLENDNDTREMEAFLDREIFTISCKMDLEGFIPTKFFPLGKNESKDNHGIKSFPNNIRLYIEDQDYISYIRDSDTFGYIIDYIKINDEYIHQISDNIKLSDNSLVEVSTMFI